MIGFITLPAVALFYKAVNAHLIMQSPTPFNNKTIDNSPLSASGSDFPCKSNGQANFYDSTGITNNMAIGEKQTLSFRGNAVHGGGSCQLAITSDEAPTPSSTWQVIQSIEGGCPSKTGDGPSTYDFSIPDDVAPGQYVFAWTWISKLAGQPEFYMNCAPITVSAGSGKKRSENAAPAKRAAALPNLAVYNLASVNSCKTSPGTDPVFPDPGPNVVKPGASPSYANPVGSNCFPVGGSGSSSSNASPDTGAANSASPVASGPAAVTSSTPAAIASGNPSGNPSSNLSGGNGTVATTFASVVVTRSIAAVVPPSSPSTSALPAISAPTATPFSNSTSPGSTAGSMTGPCSTEGIWNCISGTSFQRCASGQWSAVEAMPAGTTCTPGQTENIFARSARFVRRNPI